MSSGESTSPATSLSRFFRRVVSSGRNPKSPTASSSSFSAPLPCGNSNDDNNNLHQVFNYFDENGDGKISAEELKSRLENQLSDEEAEMAVRSSDADGDGMLGLDDFTKMMKEGEGEEKELREAFVMYCGKSKSKSEPASVITAESLRRMMRRLGQPPTTVKECKEMIGRFDVNGDGVLDFEEFRTMMS